MGTTACWANNQEFDCAMVYFGYGSRHDMMCSPGYWLSLNGLKVLAEYDYEYKSYHNHLHISDKKQMIIAEQMGLEWDENNLHYIDVPEERVLELPLYIQMELSAIRIIHPDGIEKSLDWYKQVLEVSGKYPKSGYEEIHGYFDYNGGYHTTKFVFPSMEKIKEINIDHWQQHKNVEYREELAIQSLGLREKRRSYFSEYGAKPEDIREMLLQWDIEKEERDKELAARQLFNFL